MHIKPIRERIEAKLDRELIVELEQYCHYFESDRDYEWQTKPEVFTHYRFSRKRY